VTKRNYLALFIFLLASSVTLVACDSGDDEDTEVAIEVETETTTTVVAPTAPVVQDVVTQIATSLSDIVGDDVAPDPSSGAITQISTTATSSAGTQTTTTATIVPLVNATTGQATAQAVVTVQSAGTTSTVVTSLASADPASLVSSVQSSSGAQTLVPLDASFNPGTVTTQNTSQDVQFTVSQLNGLFSSIPNYSSTVEGAPGQTWAQLITAAIAAGKSGDAEVNNVLTALNLSAFTVVSNNIQSALNQCSANSSVTNVTVTYDLGSGPVNVPYTCSALRTASLG